VSAGALRGQKGSAYRGFPYKVLEIVLLCELRELKPTALLAEEKPYLAAEIGIPTAENLENHARYLDHWINAMKAGRKNPPAS